MDSKFSILPTVRAHYATLVDDQTGARHIPDYLVSIGIPLGAGVCAAVAMQILGLKMSGIGAYIGGVTIFTALLFGLVIYIFQLRMQLDADHRVARDSQLVKLIDQLFSNVTYAVVVGVVTTVVAMLAAAVAQDGFIGPYWTGALVITGLHLVAIVFMCIKRVQAAYDKIRKLPRTTPV